MVSFTMPRTVSGFIKLNIEILVEVLANNQRSVSELARHPVYAYSLLSTSGTCKCFRNGGSSFSLLAAQIHVY